MTRMPDLPPARHGIIDVEGVRVGHYTFRERPTGCTVILTEAGAVAGVDVRGSAPGTRETDLLDPVHTVQQVHAVVLAGGSAFGLDAAGGAMRYLRERGAGFPTAAGPVPVVPAAILYDLGLGDASIWPGSEAGYAAAAASGSGPVAEGNVGAGAGATVGKLMGADRAMKGGLGTASLDGAGGIRVAAIAAVNCMGSVVDPATGQTVAGVRDAQGGLVDVRRLVRSAWTPGRAIPGSTTLGVVLTDAALTKAQATKVAQMAQDGLARTIYPAHMPTDGDVVFALATGAAPADADPGAIGALAAELMADAILHGVRAAESLPGFPACRDYP